MQRCLELAAQGLKAAMPNPSVGAVLVHNNRIIGEGFTSSYGGNHGEVNCLNSVKKEDQHLVSKSTLFVSLEPCSHFGKTPPCANLIVENNIPRVVIGCVDSFSEVAGKGIEKLKNNGIEVITGVLEEECRELNKRFFTFHEKKRPFILLKWAKTKDGFIAPNQELHSQQRWITGEKTNQYVHQFRGLEKAILVGKNTVIADNPSLTVRLVDGNNPIRIVIDKNLELWNMKQKFNLFDDSAKTIVINSISNFEDENIEGISVSFENGVLEQLVSILYSRGIQSMIVEGGTTTINAFLGANLWDEALVLEGNKTFVSGIKEPDFEGHNYKKLKKGKDDLKWFKNKTL